MPGEQRSIRDSHSFFAGKMKPITAKILILQEHCKVGITVFFLLIPWKTLGGIMCRFYTSRFWYRLKE